MSQVHKEWLQREATKKPEWLSDVPQAPQVHLPPQQLHLAQFRDRQHERMRAAGWPVPRAEYTKA